MQAMSHLQLKMRLSCKQFADNQARLQLHVAGLEFGRLQILRNIKLPVDYYRF